MRFTHWVWEKRGQDRKLFLNSKLLVGYGREAVALVQSAVSKALSSGSKDTSATASWEWATETMSATNSSKTPLANSLDRLPRSLQDRTADRATPATSSESAALRLSSLEMARVRLVHVFEEVKICSWHLHPSVQLDWCSNAPASVSINKQ